MLSVIVCCYNEAKVLPAFHRRLMAVLTTLSIRFELLYVNDGSRDESLVLLTQFCQVTGVHCLNLSRNFGKEAAMVAGIDYARGDAVLFIDADLQDPPELIPSMVHHWLGGRDIVNMQRRSRVSDASSKRISAHLYYKLMGCLVDRFYVPPDVSDFRLIGPAPLAALRAMPERTRFMKGLIGWLGFDTIEVPYDREPRSAGQTKWGPFALVDLGIEGVLAVSRKPLRWFSLLSLLVFIATLAFIIQQFSVETLTTHHFLLGIAAFIALGTAMIGEYLGATLSEVRQRPIYLLNNQLGEIRRQAETPDTPPSREQETT
ncbi:glycosyltransferase [Pseudomonas sp. PA-1-2A]|nr:glycosyltransferase [Pseudomonas sp. PA-1-8C]MCF5787347.1 glycosyltransferase [Pseudomonas sp. PA-1-6G]MCF5790943.1 glycosyltransferase [Pseudomonas sp. PA-1-6B]MCF5797926.1 glycosyltransferase [Pseudomonas sp. PA-1-5A]MCF5811856.1 glycosyltransferase [Pseudomonas sp. PA-1-2A]MCF5832748.1 glycosyltransferase [Pseudomonas sp. PA-1-6A]MCF8965515.1 glycosyltransferase [Pseudomonas carnis]